MRVLLGCHRGHAAVVRRDRTAGVVHQHIDRRPLGDDLVDGGRGCGPVGEIHLHGEGIDAERGDLVSDGGRGQFLVPLLRHVQVDVEDRDIGAEPGESESEIAAHPAGASGDDRPLTRQLTWHWGTPSSEQPYPQRAGWRTDRGRTRSGSWNIASTSRDTLDQAEIVPDSRTTTVSRPGDCFPRHARRMTG
jgi:hypothetical protein